MWDTESSSVQAGGGAGRLTDMFGGRRRRHEEQLAAKDRWRIARRLLDEDVTVLGEQVADLHVDTLADDLDATARDHYRRALEHYEQAALLLAASETLEDVVAVEQVVVDQAAVEISARSAGGGGFGT